MSLRCYFFNNFLGQISGRPPQRAGEKGPGKDREDYYRSVRDDLKSLASKKMFEALTSAKDAEDLAHEITGKLSGNDRDGWQFAGVSNGRDIQLRLVSLLSNAGFKHEHAQKLAHRILERLPQHWGR